MNDPTVSQQISPEQLRFEKEHRKFHRFIRISRILLLLLFLSTWEYTARTGLIDSFFFSSPSGICLCFLEMLKTKELLSHIGVTLLETVCSFFLVLFLSLGTATLLWSSAKLSGILEPYLVILNSLPKSALAPLLIVWLGTGIRTIITAGISVAVFGAVISLYTVFLQADSQKLLLIRTLGGNRKDCFFKVVLPSSVPVILSTMKVNIGLALVGVIIGEFLAARRGLGYLIIYASQVFQLDMLITSILILCGIALGLYQIIQLAEHAYRKRA